MSWVFLINFLLTVICFFYLSYSNVSPELYGGKVYDKDFLFWIGNSISFMKGLPVQNFRLVGEKFYYHYFSSVLMAQTSFITRIEIVDLSYFFSYIIPCWLLSLGSYSFLKSELKNKALIFIGLILILLTDGLTSYLHDHLYFCPFGFDYAYALSMISFSYISEMYNDRSYRWNELLMSCFLLILTIGFKGPNGVILLFAYGMFCFNLLLDRDWKKAFGLGALWLACFFFAYFVFLTDISNPEREANGLLFLGILGSFDTNPFAIKILNKLIDFGFPDNGLSRIISLVLYIFLNNMGAIFLLLIGIIFMIYLVINKKNDALLLPLIGTSLWGIMLTIITHQDGNSQMYFIMSALPFCVLSGLYAVDKYIRKQKIVVSFIIILSIISISDVFRFFNNCIYENISNSITLRSGGVIEEDRRYFFTKEEYRLALWLKENTEPDDYIALDSFEFDKKRKEVMMGVFSERFIWDDGQYSSEIERNRRRQLVNNAISGDVESLVELKTENVKYIIQTLSQNPKKMIESKQVFNSDNFVVYKIK